MPANEGQWVKIGRHDWVLSASSPGNGSSKRKMNSDEFQCLDARSSASGMKGGGSA